MDRVAAALLVLIGAWSASSCSAHDDAGPRPASSRTTPADGTHGPTSSPSTIGGSATKTVNGFPVQTDALTLRLPITAYMPTVDDRRTFSIAETLLANDCLGEFGFAPTPMPNEVTDADRVAESLTGLRYGMYDVEVARTYGFDMAARPEFVEQEARLRERQKQADQLAQQESPARIAARGIVSGGQDVDGNVVHDYQGSSIPSGGCYGEADRKLSGRDAVLAVDNVANQIQHTSWSESKADPRVQKAMRDWSACAAESGFDAPDPITLNNGDWPRPRPSNQEKSAAITAARCGAKVNLLGVWYGVEVELQQQMIDQQAEHLDQVKQRLRHAVTIATDVLSNRK